MPLVTKGEFAALMKVGASAVSNWARKGLLVYGEDPDKPGKQKVDSDKSMVLIRGTIDPTRGRPRTAETAQAEAAPGATTEQTSSASRGAGALSLMEQARLDEMRERSTRRRIENGQLLGQLVSVAEYERRAGEMGRKIRERCHGAVRNMSERLAAEGDPRVIMQLMGDALDLVFNRVADELEADLETERAVDAELEALPEEEADAD